MILKAKNTKSKVFKGVTFDVLVEGEKSMVTKMNYTLDDHVPFHSHFHEQSGYVVSGKYRLIFGEFDEIIETGDSYSIPGNVEHSIEIIEPGNVIDFFVPAREDYR